MGVCVRERERRRKKDAEGPVSLSNSRGLFAVREQEFTVWNLILYSSSFCVTGPAL